LDRIFISDLQARCIIGVWEEERREKQDVIINIVLSTDLRKPGRTDRFEDALDYRDLKKKILHLIENSKYFLVEALAEAIAAFCLENEKVIGARVRVEKPGALRFARSVGVEIERERS
jgi:FolB domain-containing protein